MQSSFGQLASRFEKLESTLDGKIKNTVLSVINPEITKLKSDFKAEVDKIRREVNSISKKCREKDKDPYAEDLVRDNPVDHSLNIVIRNLPESNSENIADKVNLLIKEGLKINTSVDRAERKTARNTDENGVVVAKCRDSEDKSKIMKEKSVLRDSKRYKNVFIQHDRPKSDRNTIANLNTIANVIGKDKVYVRGTRIIPRNGTTEDRNGRNENRFRDSREEYRHNRDEHPSRYRRIEHHSRDRQNRYEYRSRNSGSGEEMDWQEVRHGRNREHRSDGYRYNPHNNKTTTEVRI